MVLMLRRNRNLPILRGLARRDDGQGFEPDSASLTLAEQNRFLVAGAKKKEGGAAYVTPPSLAPATGIEPVTNP